MNIDHSISNDSESKDILTTTRIIEQERRYIEKQEPCWCQIVVLDNCIPNYINICCPTITSIGIIIDNIKKVKKLKIDKYKINVFINGKKKKFKSTDQIDLSTYKKYFTTNIDKYCNIIGGVVLLMCSKKNPYCERYNCRQCKKNNIKLNLQIKLKLKQFYIPCKKPCKKPIIKPIIHSKSSISSTKKKKNRRRKKTKNKKINNLKYPNLKENVDYQLLFEQMLNDLKKEYGEKFIFK